MCTFGRISWLLVKEKETAALLSQPIKDIVQLRPDGILMVMCPKVSEAGEGREPESWLRT